MSPLKTTAWEASSKLERGDHPLSTEPRYNSPKTSAVKYPNSRDHVRLKYTTSITLPQLPLILLIGKLKKTLGTIQ